MWHCRRVPSKAYLQFENLNESACTSVWEMQKLSTVMKALGLLEKHTKEKRLSFFLLKTDVESLVSHVRTSLCGIHRQEAEMTLIYTLRSRGDDKELEGLSMPLMLVS